VASSPGGQKQHPGATLERVAQPDHHVTLPLSGACACGQDLSELPATPLPERRQVTARVIRREVTEYRTVAGTCPGGRVHRSACPDAVRAPVPYGPGVSAVAVFLTQFPHRPYPRTADLLARVAGIALSPGTIYTLVQAAARLAAPVAAIGEALIKQTVAHADETGVRIGGKRHGLQVLSATCLTFFAVHAQRGRQALAAIGLLARCRGMLVHDHWSAYASYDCTPAYGNAHHLRELIAMAETDPRRRWPQALIDLRCEANAATKRARAAGFAA
jgi:transposase